MENENGTVSIKMEYGFPDQDSAFKAYGSLMTAIAMLRSFGNNTPRFRVNYPETFVGAELEYQSETGESAHEAAEWTHEMLREYFSILQMCIYPLACAVANTVGEEKPDKELLLNPNVDRAEKSFADMSTEEVMAAIENILNSNKEEEIQ
jgi:hypothetical protein